MSLSGHIGGLIGGQFREVSLYFVHKGREMYKAISEKSCRPESWVLELRIFWVRRRSSYNFRGQSL